MITLYFFMGQVKIIFLFWRPDSMANGFFECRHNAEKIQHPDRVRSAYRRVVSRLSYHSIQFYSLVRLYTKGCRWCWVLRLHWIASYKIGNDILAKTVRCTAERFLRREFLWQDARESRKEINWNILLLTQYSLCEYTEELSYHPLQHFW